MNEELDLSAEVAEAFLLQDRAIALLERLRAEEPFLRPRSETLGGGRRDFRRWPTPPGIHIEIHDELMWHSVECLDLGVGGARITDLPAWVKGPVPVRLKAPEIDGILVLADVMWKEHRNSGLRFEFQDEDERDAWSGALIDALLAHHSLA
jgi:hypothetical protein